MKKETIEDAAIRLYPDNIIKLGNETSYNAASLKRKDFIDGGNWVKERMYSEEEIEIILKSYKEFIVKELKGLSSFKDKNHWFAQFKKK